jgi:hypothetical protein
MLAIEAGMPSTQTRDSVHGHGGRELTVAVPRD